jgi:hypothetical protein
MPEVFTELATSFTTADTEGPVTMWFSGDELVLEFANFGTPPQRIAFNDVRAFSWSGWENAPPEAFPDRIYRVTGTRFLAPWEKFSVRELRFAHFKLGFNAEGKFLDVVATGMENRTPNQSSDPTRASVTPPAGQEPRPR